MRFPRSAPVALLAALSFAACGRGSDPAAQAKAELGRRVFTEISDPKCSTCHTLEDAGATGRVGPDLDQLKPDSQRVVTAVTNGVGIMPSQQDNLTTEQIQAVAYYVSHVTGGEGEP